MIAVNSGGVVTALMEGSSSVQATDQKNPLHFASAKVWCAIYVNGETVFWLLGASAAYIRTLRIATAL